MAHQAEYDYIVIGSGFGGSVGGGSLIYANQLLVPPDEVFQKPYVPNP